MLVDAIFFSQNPPSFFLHSRGCGVFFLVLTITPGSARNQLNPRFDIYI